MNPAAEDPQATDDKVVAWIEKNIGGTVTHIERQSRWRPVHFVDLEKDGKILPLIFRGDRVDTEQVFTLEHEMLVQDQMYKHGVRVPKVYGWCDDPRGYVMDTVPGVPHFETVTDEQRRQVMRDYMKLLADMHKLPVQPFKDAGIIHAENPEEAHLVGMRYMTAVYRRTKKRPDPFLEFALNWIDRHPLKPPCRESLVTWDSGQFHQQDGKLVAMLDVELGHIGDPMIDLAAFRQRDTVLHYGDLDEIYGWYAEFSGEPVDMDAIKWHHCYFTLSNILSFHGALAEPPPDSDMMTNMQWCNETNRFAIEAIADAMNIELPEITMPEPDISPANLAFEHLINNLRSLEAPDAYLQHQLRVMFRMGRHLKRWDEVGRQIVSADLDDMAPLLGYRPATWQEGDAALEKFVLTDNGKHDVELVHLFNRRLQRAQTLNGPPGSAMAKHLKLQSFKR